MPKTAVRKYEELGRFLREQKYERVPMTFADIERVTGTKLPRSQRYPAWWSNNTSNNVMTKIWLDAGYRTEQVDVERKKLVFRRVTHAKAQQQSGLNEVGGMYKSENDTWLKDGHHPAVGSMKGMFTIAPGVDITAPVYTDKEWDEIMEEWGRNWDALGFKVIE